MKTKTPAPVPARASLDLVLRFKDAAKVEMCARALAESSGMTEVAQHTAKRTLKEATKAREKAEKKLRQSIADHAQLDAIRAARGR